MAHRISGGLYQLFPHIRLLNRKLLDVVAGRIKRLIISMPPRHSKSMSVSQYFAAWYVMVRRNRRLILASYGAEFAAEWGRKARAIVEQFGHYFGVSIDRRSTAADRWDLAGLPGGMVTTGVGGSLTGRGGDLILDDPIKNQEEAMSLTYRDKTWDWFRSTFLTRLPQDGFVIVPVTRWNEDDLVGRILKSDDAGEWEYLCLPAIAETNDDALGRKIGEPLCPGLFNAEALARKKAEVGSYVWAGLYQQRPAPPEGGIIKRTWFEKRWTKGQNADTVLLAGRPVQLHDCLTFTITDLAVSTKESADYTVITTLAMTVDSRRDLIILNVKRSRMEGPDILPAIAAEMKTWKSKFAGIETVAFQLSLVQAARRAGMAVREMPADKDKTVRAIAATPHMEAGKVWLPVDAPWLADFESEIFSFPNATHDDQTDTLTYGCAFAQGTQLMGVPKVTVEKEVDDRSPMSENLTSRAASPFGGR
jgi:predicted phage terminase large subunit-like protein